MSLKNILDFEEAEDAPKFIKIVQLEFYLTLIFVVGNIINQKFDFGTDTLQDLYNLLGITIVLFQILVPFFRFNRFKSRRQGIAHAFINMFGMIGLTVGFAFKINSWASAELLLNTFILVIILNNIFLVFYQKWYESAKERNAIFCFQIVWQILIASTIVRFGSYPGFGVLLIIAGVFLLISIALFLPFFGKSNRWPYYLFFLNKVMLFVWISFTFIV